MKKWLGHFLKCLAESNWNATEMYSRIQLIDQLWIYVLFQLVQLYLKMSLQMFLMQER